MTDDRGAFAPVSELPSAPEFPEIEQQIIGHVLVKPALFELVADKLAPGDFVEESYGRIWAVFQQMYQRDIPLSSTAALEPIIDELGWPRGDTGKLLARLMGGTVLPVPSQTVYLAQQIRDVALRRAVHFIALDMLKRTQGGLDNTGTKLLEETESQLYAAANAGAEEERAWLFADAIAEGLAQATAAAQTRSEGELIGVPTGIGPIDAKLSGLRDTDLFMVGSRPGVGKTSWANRVARAAAEKFVQQNPEKPAWVYFFSLEMSADQLALRQMAAEARISYERIRNGYIEADELMRLDDAGKVLRDLPIRIDDTAQLNVGAMRTRIRRWTRRKGPVKLVIIDYLQLVGLSREEFKGADGNRVQEVSYITRALKKLAKDLNVPVLCLAQLNREVEKREDKRPMLSDLRESGSAEQDSDVVAFLYREHYYALQRRPQKKDRESDFDYQLRVVEWQTGLEKVEREGEFIISKNRHGSTGTLKLSFNPELMLWGGDTPGGAGVEDRAKREQQFSMELDDRIV